MVLAHPFITIVILFVVFFTIFFLLIYGILRYADKRKSGSEKVSDDEINSQKGIPTFPAFKRCGKCGTTMPGVASFCPECGAPQIAA